MLPFIYAVTSLLVIITIIRKHNPVTFVSLYGLGTIIYGMPLFFGSTAFIIASRPSFSLYYSVLDWHIYAMYFGAQAVFFVAGLFERPKHAATYQLPNDRVIAAMNVVFVVCFILFLKTLGTDALSVPKYERLDRINVFYYMTSILAKAFLLLYVLSKRKLPRKHIVLPLCFAALDLVIGFRAMFLAAAGIAVAYSEVSTLKFTGKSKVKATVFALTVIALAFVYKPVQSALTGGRFSLDDAGHYISASFVGNEPFANAGVLNEVLADRPQLPYGYLSRSLIQYIPFYTEVTNRDWQKFNPICQSLFPEAYWGMASTAFGELFLEGGWLAIAAFLLAQLLCLWMRPPKHIYSATLYYFLGPYLFIYFYRNDWLNVLGVTRLWAMAAALVGIVYVFLRTLDHMREVHLRRQTTGAAQ